METLTTLTTLTNVLHGTLTTLTNVLHVDYFDELRLTKIKSGGFFNVS